MTSLDQAFLKAYLRRHAAAAHSPAIVGKAVLSLGDVQIETIQQNSGTGCSDARDSTEDDPTGQCGGSYRKHTPPTSTLPGGQKMPNHLFDGANKECESADTKEPKGGSLPVLSVNHAERAFVASTSVTDVGAQARPLAAQNSVVGSDQPNPPDISRVQKLDKTESAKTAKSIPACLAKPTAECESTAADASRALAESCTGSFFSPQYMVDRVHWPSASIRLALAAGTAIDGIVDPLLAKYPGRGIALGLSSPHPQRGCTTVVLSVARRLLQRGLEVAVVDADFAHPMLAQRLGLLPELGWESVVDPPKPVAEVAIRVKDEPLTVIPWLAHSAKNQPASPPPLQVVLSTLEKNHDFVLVDLGMLLLEHIAEWAALEVFLKGLKGMLLVVSTRDLSDPRIQELAEKLSRSGMEPTGIIENFAPLRMAA